MKSLESKVDLTAHAGVSTTYADKEASPQSAEVAYEEKRAAEKPKDRGNQHRWHVRGLLGRRAHGLTVVLIHTIPSSINTPPPR